MDPQFVPAGVFSLANPGGLPGRSLRSEKSPNRGDLMVVSFDGGDGGRSEASFRALVWCGLVVCHCSILDWDRRGPELPELHQDRRELDGGQATRPGKQLQPAWHRPRRRADAAPDHVDHAALGLARSFLRLWWGRDLCCDRMVLLCYRSARSAFAS